LVFELSPPILYDLGFEPAMEWLAEHMQQQYGLVVEVEDDDQPKPLDNEARVLLFRAVRELLFNVLKHAQASCTKVRIKRVGEHLRIIVEDNGVGFAPDKLVASSGKIEGFGLFSIRERLNYFGGRMEIESTPGEVTRVILSLPLRRDKKKRPSSIATPTPVRLGLPPAASQAVSLSPAKPRPPSSAAVG
jgi:signal transduction histidine kinase